MSQATNTQTLPVWDLSDLYPGPDSPALQTDLAEAELAAKSFKGRYAGKLTSMAPEQIAAAISEYEHVEERLGRIMSYAQLLFSSDSSNSNYGQFYQTMSESVTDISSHLIFFTLEINRLDDAELERKLAASASLRRYQPWLRDLRVFRPHQLSDEIEELLHDKEVTGQSAWSRLFDETVVGMRVRVANEQLTVNAALEKLSDSDRAVRKAAGEAIGSAFLERIRLFSLITNTKAKDKEIIDRWRHYPHAESNRNLSNMVEDEVVDALVQAVVAAYPRLSHRYYMMKAKWLGLEKLAHFDRNAPLPGDDDRKFTWGEARDRVLHAYRAFSPEMAKVGQRFFDSAWIDVPPREGKGGGAFSHPTVPSAHPYLLLNYHGRSRDIMTLAHELGHGVHQVLAGGQGYLMAGTPLTLAETASVFGEMLTFRSMLDSASADQRRFMLTSKVEDMLNTVVRQIAFFRFEMKVHAERRNGELMPERIGEIWREIQTESLGPAFEFSPEYDVYWAYIPHFVHSPFYVYAYAFGDCLVNTLYSVFQTGHPGFQVKYLEMLRAGGTKRHKELLAPFGLDASDPGFWTKGLNVISGFIDELEATA
jgi:oligoendopeptidase F